MQTRILLGLDKASQAEGLTVVIDVFRAFSTACYFFKGGAETVLPVATTEKARALKVQHPEFLLAGERAGMKPDDFDLGNSPNAVLAADVRGKTIIFATSLGTKALVAAQSATEIITGSFVNASAICAYIKRQAPTVVSFVCSGSYDEKIVDEDMVCARYLENELLGRPNDFQAIVKYLREEGPYSGKFFDPECLSHPREDFDLCLALDEADFVLKAIRQNDDSLSLKSYLIDKLWLL